MRSVHVYPSTFEYESRILRITRTLVEETRVGEVIVIAQAAEHLPERERIDARREVRRIGTRMAGGGFWGKAARFGEWSLRVVAALRREKIDMVNCHSLSVLPLCVALARMHRAILVYEPHELETETATFEGSRKKLAKAVERRLIGRARRVIVVSDSIARRYREEYGLAELPDVILNAPPRGRGAAPGSSVFRDLYAIPPDHLIFMYQGVLDAARGCGMLLEAFRAVPPDRHVVFLGFGPMQEEIAQAAQGSSNIHFHPAVPPDKVLDFTRGADVGFALLDDSCLNHRCALPNKLFHYLHAGLPVVVSDLEEMGALVDRWQCGWRSANTPQALAQRVSAVTPAQRARAAEGAEACARALNWENEAVKLVRIYDDLVGPKPRQLAPAG